jgi:glyoxylase-like metal-dependent hydrolase (beta-lactamase superfamily II)
MAQAAIALAPDGQVTLVDAGVKRAPARIVAGLAAIGRAPSDVTRIMLTHAHSDHGGGAAELARATGRQVTMHADDAPLARRGERPTSDPASGLGRMLNRLGNKAFDPVDVSHELHDGEVVPVLGGLRVLHTPGHTPGHVSLLHTPTGVLITGDAVFNVLGLRWPMRGLCTDFRLTQQTAQILGQVNYRVAAFTHGPHISENARERVRTFLTRSSR